MNIRILAKAVLRQKQQILLLRRSETDTRRPLQWDLPGGNVESGEGLVEACVREIAEESGLTVDKSDLRLFYTESDTFEENGSPLQVIWLYFYADVQAAQVVLSFEHDTVLWVEPNPAIEQVEYDRLKRALINYRNITNS